MSRPLTEILRYDEHTGEFHWMVNRGGRPLQGNVAGYVDVFGYVIISVDGRRYKGHVLAWFFKKGEWPSGQVDHRNLNRSDNRWTNLREATPSQNRRNSGTPAHNTSGLKGVSKVKSGKWVAQIRVGGGKNLNLGRYSTKSQAKAAYDLAAYMFHSDFANFGD